jgi:hypothetical protein
MKIRIYLQPFFFCSLANGDTDILYDDEHIGYVVYEME